MGVTMEIEVSEIRNRFVGAAGSGFAVRTRRRRP
jgi:hypothetical protein